MLPFLATQPANLNLLSAALVVGVLIGVFGHIIKSRPVILTGILIVGALSVYFVVFTMVPQN